MYRDYFDAELVAAARARSIVMRSLEKRLAALLFNATTWTGASLTTAITNEWDDHSNAVPVTDVNAAKQAVFDGSGLWPNCAIMNRKVFENARLCTQVQNIISASGAGDRITPNRITEQMLADALGVDFVLVGGAPKNTAAEGQAASISSVWSDEYVMVARVATTDDPSEPCVARIFHWAEDGSQIGATMETYRDESARSDIVRARMDTDEIVMYTEAAHLLSNATT
jgi:hypothetical protein